MECLLSTTWWGPVLRLLGWNFPWVYLKLLLAGQRYVQAQVLILVESC